MAAHNTVRKESPAQGSLSTDLSSPARVVPLLTTNPPILPAQLQDLSLLLTLLSESLQQKALTGAVWSIHTEGTAIISHIGQNKNENN